MSNRSAKIILLNGPLGCGKSTLGELMADKVDRSVFFDGDALCALNPAPADEMDAFHGILAILFAHHLDNGYKNFIVSHAWESRQQIDNLVNHLSGVTPNIILHVLLLSLSRKENLKRIGLRRKFRAIDETAFEDRQFEIEYGIFSNNRAGDLGVPFDASDPAEELVSRACRLTGLAEGDNSSG